MKQLNKPTEPHPYELALPACTERSERALLALSEREGSGAEVEPPCGRERSKSRRACPACPEASRRERSRRERSERALTEGSPPHRALPKLNANRGTNLLAIVLSYCKQRATILSNRGEMRVVQSTLAPLGAHRQTHA